MKFLQKSGLLLLILSLQVLKAQNTNVQKPCGTRGPSPEWEMEFQKLVKQHHQNQEENKTQQVYVIPVIFHVIHGGQPVGYYPNVTPDQVTWQIATLNNDFAGTGYYSANYPANAFAAWAATANVSPASLNASGGVAIADCKIEFCLATKDTNGNILAEPGIERFDYNVMGWPNPAAPTYSTLTSFVNLFETTIKPQTIWDVTKYLNIWVSDDNYTLGISGYATYPYLSTLNDLPPNSIGTASTDGVWCRAFDLGYAGHLASHEIGHWLGLWHTWADNFCGNDYCNDTPPAPSETSGSPTYPYSVNACAGAGDGVMFMNFMDYTDNDGRYMFTADQASRMQTTMANSPYRKYLGTHNLCSVQNMPVASLFNSYNTICTSKALNLSNQSLGWPPPSSYTWSCPGSTFNPGPQAMSPSVMFPAAGIYTVTLAASNGSVSVFTKTINVTSPTLYFSSTSQTICPGGVANFTVDGVNTYTWQPGNLMNTEVSFTPSASQTYTCQGLEANNCGVTVMVDVVVATCVGLKTYPANELDLQIYPNPANEILKVEISADRTSALTLQIVDALGRTVYGEKINTNSDTQFVILDISLLDAGIYFIKVRSADGRMHSQKFVKED